tara:strand:- start:144 stop:278 length:135 start_codon:yes stop_codon:yes gene_type:complete
MLLQGMILKKLPQQLNDKAWKTALYLVLLISWGVILVGSFSLFS